MKILVDMNLSPAWIEALREAGHEAVHWSHTGAPTAADSAIMAWAAQHGYVVFTHDLDFGSQLYATAATAPSVIQIRSEDVRPNPPVVRLIIQGLSDAAEALNRGALVTVDPRKRRIRLLPLKS